MAGLSFKMCSGAADAGGVGIRNGEGGVLRLEQRAFGRLVHDGSGELEWGSVDERWTGIPGVIHHGAVWGERTGECQRQQVRKRDMAEIPVVEIH